MVRTKRQAPPATLTGSAFLLSLLILIAVSTIFKLFVPFALNRTIFFTLLAFLVCIQLLISWLRPVSPREEHRDIPINLRDLAPYISLLLIVSSFVFIFRENVFDSRRMGYDFNEENILAIPLGQQTDLLERFGLADSLNTQLFPYWDLEYADTFGYVFTDPPLYAFVNNFSILLFGETKTTLRLVSIAFIAIMFLAIMAQGRPGKSLRFGICGLLSISYLMFFIGRIDELIYTVPFFSFLLTIAYLYLMRANFRMFLLFAVAATLTKFYGVFFTLLALVIFALLFSEHREGCLKVLKQYIFFVAGCVLFVAAVGQFSGHSAIYWRNFVIEHFLRLDVLHVLDKTYPHLVVNDPAFKFSGGWQLIKGCLWATAFMFPALFIFGRNREENFYSLIGLIYTILIFSSRFHMERYIILLIPFTAIVLCSKLERWTKKNKAGPGIQKS